MDLPFGMVYGAWAPPEHLWGCLRPLGALWGVGLTLSPADITKRCGLSTVKQCSFDPRKAAWGCKTAGGGREEVVRGGGDLGKKRKLLIYPFRSERGAHASVF